MANPLKLIPCELDDQARAELSKIDGLTAEHLDDYQAKIEAGTSVVKAIERDGNRVGCCILRLANEGRARVLCFDELALAHHDQDEAPLLSSIEVLGLSLARHMDCTYVRFHTNRPGFLRVLKGWQIRYTFDQAVT